MPSVKLHELTRWISSAALTHPRELRAEVVRRGGLSPRRAGQALRELEAAGWLVNEGTPRKPCHRPGVLRQVVQTYSIDGLAEDRAWRQDFAPCFELPPQVQQIVQHAFGELLNNAIDHSGASQVTVSLRQTASHVQMMVSDDGIGLFERIREAFSIDEASHAMLELSKGLLTTSPAAHCGRGLFLVAQLADVLQVGANGHAFQRVGWEEGAWRGTRGMERRGTSVYFSLLLDTPRTLDTVLAACSHDGSGAAFDRTTVPLRLLITPHCSLLDSRALARRVSARLARFRHARIDFHGVGEVGHGFVDELFRVFARDHAGLHLEAVNPTPRTERWVAEARAAH